MLAGRLGQMLAVLMVAKMALMTVDLKVRSRVLKLVDAMVAM
jgi:hypothetical protein